MVTNEDEGRGLAYCHGVRKRVFDVVAALFLLLAFLPPVLLFLVWIALRWRVDPLFRQRRIGCEGRPFVLLKLRTLPPSFSPEANKPSHETARGFDRLCAFLRATGLDELPQVANVLRGEMSMVGPRPEMPFVVDGYDEHSRRRLAVRPGITGPWQLLGDHRRPIHEQLRYDLLYLRRASLALDVWLCAWTGVLAVASEARARRYWRSCRQRSAGKRRAGRT